MDKALKVLVIAILALSVVAVVVSLNLYGKREELKGRTNKLADYVGKIAATIEVPQATVDLAARDAAHMTVSKEQLKQYYKVGDDGKPSKVTTGAGTMDAALVEVLVNAGRQFDRLNDTRDGLSQARTTLGQTSNSLVQVMGALTVASNNLETAKQDLVVAKQDVEKKTGEFADLNSQIEANKADIEKKTSEIAKLGEKLSDTESKIEAGKRYIQKVEKQLKLCEGNFDTNSLPKGVQGQITVVNSNWNFVVIDMVPDAAVIPLTDLTIQRADKFVGKVRVSEVRRDQRVALGEILPDYQQKGIAPSRGDNVFY